MRTGPIATLIAGYFAGHREVPATRVTTIPARDLSKNRILQEHPEETEKTEKEIKNSVLSVAAC